MFLLKYYDCDKWFWDLKCDCVVNENGLITLWKKVLFLDIEK